MALMKYIYQFRPEPVVTDRVFLNLNGCQMNGHQMTGSGLKLIFRRLSKNSGVDRLHMYLLKHTFAANYLMNGGDVFTQ